VQRACTFTFPDSTCARSFRKYSPSSWICPRVYARRRTCALPSTSRLFHVRETRFDDVERESEAPICTRSIERGVAWWRVVRACGLLRNALRPSWLRYLYTLGYTTVSLVLDYYYYYYYYHEALLRRIPGCRLYPSFSWKFTSD